MEWSFDEALGVSFHLILPGILVIPRVYAHTADYLNSTRERAVQKLIFSLPGWKRASPPHLCAQHRAYIEGQLYRANSLPWQLQKFKNYLLPNLTVAILMPPGVSTPLGKRQIRSPQVPQEARPTNIRPTTISNATDKGLWGK